MRKILIKCAFVFGIIILVPYLLTLLMSGRNRDNFDEKEEYLIGAIAASVPGDYEEEMMKAQAVLLRNYMELNGRDKLPYIDEGERRKKWNSNYKKYEAKIKNAVMKTRKIFITYNDEIIQPYFHEVSTGVTRNGKEFFGMEIPYLISVNSVDDVTSIDFLKITEYEIKDFLEIIFNNDIPNNINEENFFEQIQIEERDSLGYVISMLIGDRKLEGYQVAELLKLNSENFYIENYSGKIRIICKGKGNGLGLSLFGGNVMAQKGADYKEILQYYFVGTNIEMK